MAAIPQKPETPPVAAAIYAVYEAREAKELARPYLGGSAIGRPCERHLWYSFRWAVRPEFSGRILRLFQRGHREEPWLVDDMRAAGLTVWATNPATGKQWGWTEPATGHHFAGNGDGIVKGVPGAEKSPHLWECKTHSTKSFTAVKKDGVEKAKPEHFAQMQIYMKWSQDEFGKTNGCKRALYTPVCKETDEIHDERLHFDDKFAQRLIDKANRIIFAATPLAKLSEDPSWYECKICDHHAVCHGTAVPQATCRSCIHATPEREGNARWTCRGVDLPVERQRTGCEDHRLIPVLLSNFADPIDADAMGAWVKYRSKFDGKEFCNSADGFTSREISACADKRALTNGEVLAMRDAFGAEVTG